MKLKKNDLETASNIDEDIKSSEQEGEKNEFIKLKTLYLIVLIILLIFTFIFSFKTGERLYYLVNTDLDKEDSDLKTDVATWNFEVRIEY